MGFYFLNREEKNMPNAVVRPLTEDDMFIISENLSEINREELSALTNISPLIALSVCASSGESYCVEDGAGNVCGAFGLIPEKNLEGTASIWMVTTTSIANIAVQFIKGSKKWIEEFNNRYRLIYCRVYDGNAFTKRWLEMMGFDHSADIENVGIHGELFLEYFRIRQ